jgi:hypothetical protein
LDVVHVFKLDLSIVEGERSPSSHNRTSVRALLVVGSL